MKKFYRLQLVIFPLIAAIMKMTRTWFLFLSLSILPFLQAQAQSTLTVGVVSSADDAEQQGNTGTSPGAVSLTSADLELVNDLQSPSAGTQTAGIRFQNVTIPQGATIVSAYITFTAVAPDSPMNNSDNTSLNIYGQAADNANTFTTTVNNISSRVLTTAYTTWNAGTWVTGSKYNTPAITGIVQELVNRSGWASGNSMAFIITGTGHRSAASWDDVGSGNEPKLVITYTTLNLTNTVTNVLCYGGNTGAINLSVTGGTPPYTYDWSNNGFTGYTDTEDLSGLTAESYVVKVKDNTGMTAQTYATITQPGAPVTPSTSVTNVSTPGGSNGAVDLSVSGGAAPYTYNWSNSATTEDISNLTAGTYSVTVTDASSCSATTSAVVGTVSNPASVTKYLYLSDPSQALDRVDPVYTNDLTTAQTNVMGIGTAKSIFAFYGNKTTNFYQYSVAGNSWTARAATPATVGVGGALTTNGTNIYGLGGNGTKNFWRYNVSLNTWTALASTPANVGDGGALCYTSGGTSGYIYALEGNNTKLFWRYDINGNTWTAMTQVPDAVGAGGSLSYTGGDYIYALRGNGQKTFYRYSISGNSWTTMANLPNKMSTGSCLTYDGTYIYALQANGTKNFYRYNISANTWTAMATTP
ncbi:MAG TPA: hypothetical protein PLE11_11775, partial [Bacteroidales bacterium]|nr:hypothetical protein [Bacteroidales bacterium]